VPDSVRLAASRDAAALHRLAALTFPLACTPHTTDEEKAAFVAENLDEAAFTRYLADPSRILLVGVDALDDLIGYTMLITGEPLDADVVAAIRHRPTIELSKMYVHPAYHGSGIAMRLIAAAVDEARATGAAGIWLGVSDENARANAFYAKHGFEQVGRKRFQVGNRWENDFVRELAV
jgi:ribosomal protein S18 acetylase RimI-like enzyme